MPTPHWIRKVGLSIVAPVTNGGGLFVCNCWLYEGRARRCQARLSG